MSYTSVMVTEGQLSWAEGMKRFRKNAEPGLKAAKKAGILNSYSVVQTGDNTGMFIFQFPNKSSRTKFAKAMMATRQSETEAMSGQSWVYHGPVKASG